MYADDTAISVGGDSQSHLEQQLNNKLGQVAHWINNNGLTLNIKKTKAMMFGTTYTLGQLNDVTIEYHGQRIEVVDQYKYFGVILD